MYIRSPLLLSLAAVVTVVSSSTVASGIVTKQTDVDVTTANTTAVSAAEHAAALLASMPACGVSQGSNS
jgi:hypothetical protein